MTARVVAMSHSHALIAEAHVDERLLVVMVASAAAVRVVVLALELVLDPLAVRRVADKRENRADALNEEDTLPGLSVVECSLQYNTHGQHALHVESKGYHGRNAPAHNNCHRNPSTISPGESG